jgi:cardiolipin synthase A/B
LASYNLIPKQPFTYNDIKLLQSGQPFFARLFELIEEARYVIHLQFYIFDLDRTGILVLDALKEASKRGVKIFVVVDAYASEQINAKTTSQFTDYGIQIKRFSPVNYKGGVKLGRRLHHKIVWVDGKYALVGGINIADKYSGFHGKEPWLDFAVEVNGPVCVQIKKVCDEVLHKRWLKQAYRYYRPEPFRSDLAYQLRIIQNDFFRRRLQISGSYRQAIRKSNDSVVIVASYFLPGNSLRRIIKKACDRGVKVTIILVGLSDVPFIKPAIIWLYDWLFRNGIEVYEWQKSVLHGKLAVVDNKWTTIGSFNLNELSDFGSLELNVEVADEKFATGTRTYLQKLIDEGCEQITAQEYLRKKNWIVQFSHWFSYQFVRIVLRFLFLFMQLREGRKFSRF